MAPRRRRRPRRPRRRRRWPAGSEGRLGRYGPPPGLALRGRQERAAAAAVAAAGCGQPGRSAFPAGVTGPPRALSGARLPLERSDVRSAEPGAAAAPLTRAGKVRAPRPSARGQCCPPARSLARSSGVPLQTFFFYLSFNCLLFLRMNDLSLLS